MATSQQQGPQDNPTAGGAPAITAASGQELLHPSHAHGTAALARLSPTELPDAAQQLLRQCVAFMQEQSSIGSEALVGMLPQHAAAVRGGCMRVIKFN